MQSNVSGGVTQVGTVTRFLPASLVFVAAHVLFLGAAMVLAAIY
jgi:hypothetical protein